MDKKEIIRHVSWIKRGKQRREIIPHLNGKQTPSEIAKKAKYSLNHTSRILNEFKKQRIVRVLNPKEKTGRLYKLTSKGKVIRDELEKKD